MSRRAAGSGIRDRPGDGAHLWFHMIQLVPEQGKALRFGLTVSREIVTRGRESYTVTFPIVSGVESEAQVSLIPRRLVL